MAKRCCDILVSAVGLLFISPILLIVAAAIYLVDGLPILFVQRRVGWQGRPFCLYKFRTMRVARRAEAGSFDAGNCARVTRLGRVLRKTKLDELPQLWNVLRGDMSLVGPRPEVEKWTTAYPERWAVVHQIRPGMTDPGSIQFRNEEELLAGSGNPEELYRDTILPRKLTLYERYIRSRTLCGDLLIILKTLLVTIWPRRSTEAL